MKGPVPEPGLAVAVPLHNPLQVTFVVVVLKVTGAGFERIIEVLVLQLCASVTCTE